MRKNYLYLLVLLVLCGLTYFLFFREAAPDYDKNEANFSIKHIEDIKTIFLTNVMGDKIKLSLVGDEWMANDTIDVVQQKVKALLEALEKQEPLKPVSIGSHDDVIKQLSSNHAKVEVYGEKDKLSTFYVCKNPAPNNMTYMLTEGAKRPYIVKMPLSDLYLGVRYSTILDDWRSRKIMHAKADEIEMIDIAYKDSTHYSFHLTHTKGTTPVITGNQVINQPLNIKRVYSYLNLWDSIYCLGYEARNKIKDTVLTNGHELATVTMKKINKPVQVLNIFFKPISKGTKGILKIGNHQYDFDVFLPL